MTTFISKTKRSLRVIICSLLGPTLFIFHDYADAESEIAINFSMDFVNQCGSKTDQVECLKNIFTKHAFFEIASDKTLKSVELRYKPLTQIKINGLGVVSKGYIKLLTNRLDDPGYHICNIAVPITIDRYQFQNPSCLCGFDKIGEFKRTLESAFDFLPKKAKLEIGYMQCRAPSTFDASSVKLINDEFACGYKFKKGTYFGEIDGFATLEPISNLNITNSDGATINMKKGRQYINEGSPKKLCNWRPVVDN